MEHLSNKKETTKKEEVQQSKEIVKLQKYAVTKFCGDLKDWLRFWDRFAAEVDGSKL